MSKVNIPTITSGFASVEALNTHLQTIEDELNNKVLYRDNPVGEPNSMQSDLDMNGHRLLNVLSTTGGDNFLWKGTWTALTVYQINNLVYDSGNTYICVRDHTATSNFGTDLSAGNWELFAAQGSAGAGTGDMLKAENLFGLASVATARTNLGLGSLATLSPSPTDGNFLVGNGTTFVVESGSTALASLGAQAELVSGTNIKTVDGNSLLGSGNVQIIPSQTGNAGKVLTTNGSTTSWSSSSGEWVSISSGNVSAVSALDLSWDESLYNGIRVVLSGVIPSSTAPLLMRMGYSNGSAFVITGYEQFRNGTTTTSLSQLTLSESCGTAAGETTTVVIDLTLTGLGGFAGVFQLASKNGLFNAGSAGMFWCNGTTYTWDSIRLYWAAPYTFESAGTYKIYGRLK